MYAISRFLLSGVCFMCRAYRRTCRLLFVIGCRLSVVVCWLLFVDCPYRLFCCFIVSGVVADCCLLIAGCLCRWILLFFGFRVSLSGVGCWLLIASFECWLLIVGCLFRRILLFHGFQVSLSGVFVGGFSCFMVFECRCRASLSVVFVVSLFRVSSPSADCWLSDVSVGGFCCFMVFGCHCRVFSVDCQFRVLTVDCRLPVSADLLFHGFRAIFGFRVSLSCVGCWLSVSVKGR